MARLPRPHISASVELAVALKQLGVRDYDALVSLARAERRLGVTRDARLIELAERLGCEVDALELHHRPALVNRKKIMRHGIIVGYIPPANSIEHLFWLPEPDHDVETRVRGLHGQYSDLAMARKLKRIARNRDPKRRKKKIPHPKRYNWPKRKFF